MRIHRVFFLFLLGAVAALVLVLLINPADAHADECTWLAGHVGAWSDGANWTCGFAPDGDDTAILTVGTISLDSDVTVLALNQSGGTIEGAYNLTVTDALIWTSGTQEGSGRTIVAPGATMTLQGSGRSLYARVLENRGTVEWIEGSLVLNDGASIENWALFELRNVDTVMLSQGAGVLGTFWNRAGSTLRKSTAEGEAALQTNLNNAGLVEVLAGTLRQGRTGTVSTSSGDFSVSSDASLQFTSGSHTFEPGSRIYGPGWVLFGGAEVTILGDYELAGMTALTAGTVRFDVPASLVEFLQWGGTLAGAGTVTVTDAFVWWAGTQAGPGKTVLADSTSTVIEDTTYASWLDARALENWGDVVWVEGTFYLANGALFDNWGTFEIQAGSSMSNYTGDPSTFRNQSGATVRKDVAGSTASIRVAFQNAGLLDVVAGTLTLRPPAGTNSSSGEFNVSADGILDFGSGTHVLEFFSRVQGDGTVQFSGADVTVLGDYDVSGTTYQSLGTVTFDGARSVAFGDLNHTGGALSVDNQASISGDLTWRYGPLNTGSGTITFNGDEEQVISSLGPLHFYNLAVASGARLLVPSDALQPTVAGALTNDGTMKQTLTLDNSAGSGAATFSFLNLQDGSGVDKYHGLDVTLGANSNMGTTDVSIRGNQTCGATNPVKRCYDILPQYPVVSDVRFYYRAEEANENTSPYAWHWNGLSWENVDPAPARDTSDPEACWVEAQSIAAYSPFALSDEEPLPLYEGILLVKSITLKSQPNGQLVATVRIMDDTNSAVAGAEVSVQWTGPSSFSRDQSARTTKPGVARFRINPPASGVYRLCVVDVSLDNWLYDPDQNQETCETVTAD